MIGRTQYVVRVDSRLPMFHNEPNNSVRPVHCCKGRMFVLVADDEVGVVDFLSKGLRAEGHAVDVATDGFEALDRSLSPEYACLVLDWNMCHGSLLFLESWHTRFGWVTQPGLRPSISKALPTTS